MSKDKILYNLGNLIIINKWRVIRVKVVVTIVGQDRVGIIATVSRILADNNINILKINQTILEGFFNMVMIVDMTESKIKIQELQQMLSETGQQMGLDIKAQHEGIFRSMHRI